MTNARRLGAVTELFAGMTAGLACVMLALLALGAVFGIAPRASLDPVTRFDVASVSPPQVSVDPPGYQPVRDTLEQVGFFSVIAQSALPAFAGIAAPAGSDMDSRTARDLAGIHATAPKFDLPKPGPDEAFRAKDASNPSTLPHLGKVGGALPIVSAGLSVGLSADPRRGGESGPTGPEHFLQSGYFVHRENAVGLSADLANAGLNVLMEQTANRSGRIRWRVLVGPYRRKEDALRARGAAPGLLAEAFHIMQGN